MHHCSTLFEKVGVVVLYFLQSAEGGRTIAAIGGVLVILYHLKRGAVLGGRLLAALLSVVFVALLLTVVPFVVDSWDANIKPQCDADALHGNSVSYPPKL
jgi:hypothetical protein